jgi:asparagine synthetase B (glutamine-hydrolysing)
MCGILAILSLGIELAALKSLVKRDLIQAKCFPPISYELQEIEGIIPALVRRGPDSQSWCQADIGAGEGMLAMYAAVLHLRGDRRCEQPVTDGYGNILAWNGEIFAGGVDVPADCSDTLALSSRLSEASHTCRDM